MTRAPDTSEGLQKQVEAPGPDWRGWLSRRLAGLACLVIGAGSLVAMIALSVARGRLELLPPLTYTLAPLAVAVALAITSAARSERAWKLWLPGLGAAAAALVSGWVLIIGGILLILALLFWLVGELSG